MNYDKIIEMDNVTKGDCEDGYAYRKRSVIISNGHILDFLDKNRRCRRRILIHEYLKSLITKKHTWEDIKADMKLKGLKTKEYLHSIGKWDEYIRYMEENL